jgi:hypothetical protein
MNRKDQTEKLAVADPQTEAIAKASAQYERGLRKVHSLLRDFKAYNQKTNADMALLLDKMRFNGIDPDSVKGRAVLLIMSANAINKDSGEATSPLDEFLNGDRGEIEDF